MQNEHMTGLSGQQQHQMHFLFKLKFTLHVPHIKCDFRMKKISIQSIKFVFVTFRLEKEQNLVFSQWMHTMSSVDIA